MDASDQDTDPDAEMPSGGLVGLFGGVSGASSALLFESAVSVGLGTGAGVVLFFLLYRGLKNGMLRS